jgi:L-cysteine S-thiosulfotransferase
MVYQHHCRHVWLIAFSLSCPSGVGHATEEGAARALITDTRKGNCIICHYIPLPGVPSIAFGDLGPSLAGVGARLTPAQIKARIVDPRPMTPDTVMPAYGSIIGLYRVQNAYRGRPILTEAEIESLVAYLSALK